MQAGNKLPRERIGRYNKLSFVTKKLEIIAQFDKTVEVFLKYAGR